LRLADRQVGLGIVGVAFRADRAADRERTTGFLLALADLLDECDRTPVRVREPVERVAELCSPGRARAPGGGLEHEADLPLARERQVRLVVAREGGAAVVALEQRKARE